VGKFGPAEYPFGFVNRYGRGVHRAQDALRRNGSPEARFEFGDTYFLVTIPAHS